ncbi:MAG TPA: ATP-binding protein [Jiangellaceae bacterium]|nr:ATP-binding protein [Jiangellaceae bacterium]
MTEASSLRAALRVPLSTAAGEVSRARRMVSEWIRDHAVRASEENAVLLVSELVTNALRHGRPPMELRIRPLRAGGIRLEVLDSAGDDLPIRNLPQPDAVTGRGVGIVAALSNRWGSEPVAAGKLVWAEIDPD